MGPLHGVPLTIKEQFWIKNKKSTINAKIHRDFVAPEDAIVVDRIKKSGAIILGQTNVPRFLLDYQVWGDIYPEGKNPYNTEYSPGGVPEGEPQPWRQVLLPWSWEAILVVQSGYLLIFAVYTA
jgi:Asp-tRNA(Asn)/Glu-tRNA(Gln) amidotransferase A subunit family amidase